MPKHIYEIGWEITCSEFVFLRTQWRVFDSYKKAEEYGLKEQLELNDNLQPEEMAFKGYYCEFSYAKPIESIDNHRILLEPPEKD